MDLIFSAAMRHRLRGLSTYGLNGHCVGDEHLAYALGARHLYLTRHCGCFSDLAPDTNVPTQLNSTLNSTQVAQPDQQAATLAV